MKLFTTFAVLTAAVALAMGPARAAITPIAQLPHDMQVLAAHPNALMQLIDDLKLSAAQRQRMSQIIHDGMAKDPNYSTLGATPTQLQMHAQLLHVLTPAQHRQYDALIDHIEKTPAQITAGTP